MSIGQMISSDSHIIEPPDLWTTRLDRALRDHGPRAVEIDGQQWWVLNNMKGLSFAGGAQTGDRFTKPEELRTGALFDQVRPGGYQPLDHITDSEADGVIGSVMYPTQGLVLYTQANSEMLSACARAYNDWLLEFCSAAPDRLKGVAMLNVDKVEDAVAEMRRTHQLGMAGAMIPVSPGPTRPYSLPEYEPLWAAATELGIPLSMHLGANRVGADGISSNMAAIRPSYFAICETWVKESVADMIFAGVFDRYPTLQMGVIEHELGWIPFFLNRMDYTYTQRHGNANYYRFKTAGKPSDFFRRNVFCSFQDDELGIREREQVGMHGLCWGSDYPHTESTFPRSQQIMDQRLAGVPDAEKRRIVAGNCARIYGFKLPA